MLASQEKEIKELIMQCDFIPENTNKEAREQRNNVIQQFSSGTEETKSLKSLTAFASNNSINSNIKLQMMSKSFSS